jgi:hypothetical protein
MSEDPIFRKILNEKRHHRIEIKPSDRGSADAEIEFEPEHGNVTNVQQVTEADLCVLYVAIETYQRQHGMSRQRMLRCARSALERQEGT